MVPCEKYFMILLCNKWLDWVTFVYLKNVECIKSMHISSQNKLGKLWLELNYS